MDKDQKKSQKVPKSTVGGISHVRKNKKTGKDEYIPLKKDTLVHMDSIPEQVRKYDEKKAERKKP